MSFPELLVKRAIAFARAGGQEIGNAHVDPYNWSIWLRFNGDHRVVAEAQPPCPISFVERDAGVDGAALSRIPKHVLFCPQNWKRYICRQVTILQGIFQRDYTKNPLP